MREAVPVPVEKDELAPVLATDGSGLPFELWRGVDIAAFGKLISEIEIPPRSAALHNLWKRLITSDVTAPAGETSNVKFSSLRLRSTLPLRTCGRSGRRTRESTARQRPAAQHAGRAQ